jgi:hypothetical protein
MFRLRKVRHRHPQIAESGSMLASGETISKCGQTFGGNIGCSAGHPLEEFE